MMKKLNALYKGTFYDESNLSPKQFGVLLLKYFVLQTTLVFGGGTLLCQALAANGSNTFILKIAFAILGIPLVFSFFYFRSILNGRIKQIYPNLNPRQRLAFHTFSILPVGMIALLAWGFLSKEKKASEPPYPLKRFWMTAALCFAISLSPLLLSISGNRQMLKIAYWTSSPVFQYLSRISDETLEIADAKTLIKKDRSIYSSFESRKKLYSNQGEHTLTGTILMMASEVGVLSDERKRQFESLSEPNPLSSAPVPVTKESINIKLAWAMIESLSNLKKEAPKPGSLFLQFNPISLLGTGAIEALLITVVDWGMFLEFNVKTQEAMNRALDQIEQTSKDPVDIARCAEYRKINQ